MYHYPGNLKKPSVDKTAVVNLEKGKLPPQALDLEQAVLGAAMIDSAGLDDLFDVFTDAEVFYKEAHKHIFEAVKKLYENGQPVDMLTVSQQLRSVGKIDAAGGDFYVVQLTQKISSSAHIEYHARILLQKFIARRLIRFSNEVVSMAYDDTADVFEVLEVADAGFTGINDLIHKGKKSLTWNEGLKEVQKNVEILTNAGDAILGVETGFAKLNARFGGWRLTDLIIIAARPGAGKTAFTVASMIAAAKNKQAVGYFSLEMSTTQLITRGVAVNSSFHMSQLTRKGFEKDEYFITLQSVVNSMSDLPIYIDDAPTLTVSELRRKARQMKRKHDIQVLFLDYVQLAAGGDSDVRFKINELVYTLKALAKELNIAVIGLSQLSRDVEKRSPQRGRMSDLKESSAIEDAADVVAFLYRAEYYGNEVDYSVLSDTENTEFIVDKNRHGGVGTIGLWFDANKTKFSDDKPTYDRYDAQQFADSTPLPTPTPNEAFGPANTGDVDNNGIDF